MVPICDHSGRRSDIETESEKDAIYGNKMVRFLVKITPLKENSIANLTSDLKKDAINYQTGIELNISTIRQIFSSIIGNTMKPEL